MPSPCFAAVTEIGYCPVNDDGEVYQLKRGVRFAKRRQGPSAPRGKVNWHLGRGATNARPRGRAKRRRSTWLEKEWDAPN